MEKESRILGLDLGQAQDFSALVGVKRQPGPDPDFPRRQICRYTVDGLRRWELGTPYPKVVEDVCALSQHPEAKGCPLVVDATGVGRAVVDMFQEAQRRNRLKWHIVAATIHGGQKSELTPEGDWSLSKKDLVAVMQTLVQFRRFEIAPTLALAAVLGKELQMFRVKVNLATGHEQFAAWRDREHDDIVLACALACWHGERGQKPFWIGL